MINFPLRPLAGISETVVTVLISSAISVVTVIKDVLVCRLTPPPVLTRVSLVRKIVTMLNVPNNELAPTAETTQ